MENKNHMMSGEQLVETLSELNFPGASSLDPQGLDWMFENESLQPMLEWFCQHVTSSNILDTKTTEEFKNLSQSGEIILKGRQLDEALSNLECARDETVTEESLNVELEQLTQSLQHYKKQKQGLMKRRNLLSNHLTSLSHRVSKLGAIEGNVKHRYKKVLEQTHADNIKMNESLENLTGSVTDMNSVYNKSQEAPSQSSKSTVPLQVNKSGVPSQTGSAAMFLSQVPLQQYYSTEEAFTTQLTAYTRKQFFQGIAEMASSGEGSRCEILEGSLMTDLISSPEPKAHCSGEDSRYEILEVSDPDSLLIRGESEQINIRDCKELARLQELYPNSESNRIRTLCEMKKVKAHLQTAEGILESLKTGTFCTDLAKNKERLQKLQSAVQPIRRDFLLMADKEVAKVLQECKDAKVLRVLTGDYNLKLARQDYFTSNQDKVINQLVIQRSRNEFLTMALEVELRRHRELHHLLTSVYTKLQKQFTELQKRLAVMGDNSLTPARHKRETIDSRDKSTARLYHMIDESHAKGEKQLFLTYSALVENAQKLQQKLAGLESSLITSQSARQDRIHTIENNLQMCEELIYEGSSTTSGAPQFTPRQIQDTMIQLRDMTKKLEQGILDVVKDIENKKKLLRSDAFLARERKLFTYFFTNPSKLHQVMDELSSRVQAEKHVEGSSDR